MNMVVHEPTIKKTTNPHFFGMTMADYMRWLWNNPQAGQNIYKMFEGVVRPVGKDENGDLVYKYVG